MKNLLPFVLLLFAFALWPGCNKPRHTLSGVVVDDSTGQVLGGRTVEFYYQACSSCYDKKGEVTSQPDGTFAFTVKEPVFYLIKCSYAPDSTYGVTTVGGNQDFKQIILRMRNQ